MGTPFSSASFSESHYPDDDLYAAAYDALSDVRRAHIKRQIAFLYKLFASPADRPSQVTGVWDNGFTFTRTKRPLDTVIIVCGGRFSSVPQAVAAVLPPLLMGVQDVLFVRLCEPIADDMTAALELCGLEQLIFLPEHDIHELTAALEHCGESVLILLDDDAPDSLPAEAVSLGMRVVRPRLTLNQRSLGIYAPEGQAPDWEALTWAYPESDFLVIDPAESALPTEQKQGARFLQGCLEDFSAEGVDVVFAPSIFDAARESSACLLVEFGMETCWLWPVLGEDVFTTARLAVGRSPISPGEGEEA
jgi:hypothetical protein